MKRLVLPILTLTLTLQLAAKPLLQADRRYHIVCTQFQQGCVADGATAQQPTPLYYLTSATTADETWWLFSEQGDGLYTIRNAKTSQYVTYDGVRADIASGGQLRRYISMTDQPQADNSLWSLDMQTDGVYTIRNAAQHDHIWDVRTDSYCVGTYANSGNGNQNQTFTLYDQQGQQVYEQQADVSGAYNVSSWLNATTDRADGWTYEGNAWTDPGFGNYRNGSAAVVTPFLERWNDTNYGPLPDAAIYQTIDNLPAGTYTLSADIIAVRQPSNNGWYAQTEETGYGVYLFANDHTAEAGTRNERPQQYSVDFSLTQNTTLQAGLRIRSTNANWVAFDNFALYYNGTYEQLVEGEKAKVSAELADYYTTQEIEALIDQCADDFQQLEQLRLSVATLPSVDPLGRLAGNITVDGHAIVYVESTDQYLCSIPYELFSGEYDARIDYDAQKRGATLAIDRTAVAPAANYHFATVQGGRNYTISAETDDGTTVTKQLTFTSLPVVKLYGSFSNDYADGHIIVHEPDKPMPELLRMKAKWRGGITNLAGKNKRNYHVKLLDDNGDKLEQKFFGLRNDNSWILEACQVDMSRIRNRVLTDLWNDYCHKPYYYNREPKAMTGTRGRFVELILNDEYRGIYCMTENMDRKQMKLAKYDEQNQQVHGQLWKSKDWSYAVFMGTVPDGNYRPKDYLSEPNSYSDMWDSYQVKYPDIDDVCPTDWSPLYKAVEFVSSASDALFSHYISEYIDLPVLIDYYILMETILSSDNHGKNLFFACYDQAQSQKITFGVWDMDATCGQRWSDDYFHSTIMRPDQDYAEYIARYEHGDYNLFKRMRETNAYNFNEEVRLRYRDLRQNHLATENILKRFRTYLDEFKTAGADQREYARWNGDTDISRRNLDFDDEMDYLTDWFTRRMNYLDTTRFDIASLPPSGITNVAQQPAADDDAVYDLSGRRVGSTQQMDQLPAGVYLVDGKKYVKK